MEMSGSTQSDWVAMVSITDKAIIGGMKKKNLPEMDFSERQIMLKEAQQVPR